MNAINDESIEKAVDYMKKTDKPHAELKAQLSSLKDLTKTILAYEFLDADGNNEERKALSYRSESYQGHIKKIEDIEIKFQEITNRRKTAEGMIELYRTVSANQRRGNI